ncbi:hypothetical protein ACLOJK_031469 [Asimina triloba]
MRKVLKIFAFLFFLLVAVQSQDPSMNDEVLGLVAFKADLNDPGSKLSSWNVDDNNPCNWVGVKCDARTNRVTELALDGFSLSGRLGRCLLQLKFLQQLSLSRNNFNGSIDPGLAHLPSLQVLDLSENHFSGPIPGDFFQQCMSLREISFARNNFSGQIPQSLSSCWTLTSLNFSSNQLSGMLPDGLWSLKGLTSLDLSDNSLGGQIPNSLGQLSNLSVINLRKNGFSGQLPDGIGGCFLLKAIDFSENSLSGGIPDSMQKLISSSSLNLRLNSLVGQLPSWIGEMGSLELLDLSGNGFSGRIPDSMGKLNLLKVLNFSGNKFTGSLPESLMNCKSLMVVDFSQNSLTGNFPKWVLKLGLQGMLGLQNELTSRVEDSPSSPSESSYQNLQIVDFSDNNFSGTIPSEIVGLSNLRALNVSRNSLVGLIPGSIGSLKKMDVLDLSENHLNGSIPAEIGTMVALKELNLGNNILSGEIPSQIGDCSSLISLILFHNSFSGPIPATIANLSNLQTVDFSFNKLTGTIPNQFGNLRHLISFNVSHNQLEGNLPANNFFNTISPSSVSDNPSLCGSAVNRSCPGMHNKPIVLNPNSSDPFSRSGSSSDMHPKKIIFSISALIAIGAAAAIVLGVVTITLLNLRARVAASQSPVESAMSGGDDDCSQSPATDSNSGKLVMFSGDPSFSASTHTLLNKDCELGRGGFGAVYQAVLHDGRPVAIKKLTVSSLVKSQEDFEREVQKLGKIQHANLIRLEGYYWTHSLQLLIYEFVSGGSLYKHLHERSTSNFLSWQERFDIIVGIAKSLAHLHQLNVIHYNLKSSNVLIDGSGQPKVGDFGLAKLLPVLDRYVLSSKMQSALGYMAPEFACRAVKITEKCDVYGFGILILEVVTGRRPVEYMEDDVVVLSDMVREALEEGREEECVDERLQGQFPADEAVPLIKLGLICISQVPSNRPDMAEVVNIMEVIRSSSEGQEELS